MKNQGVPIVKEGWPYLGVSALAALAFFIGGYPGLAVLFLLGSFYIAYFFRNPERLAPVGANLVASPADGRVIFVGEVKESEFLGQEMTKISVFMNLFDVHVNRFPIDGTVKDMRYHKGRFMAASEDRASFENERNSMLIETGAGDKLVLTQVAGLVARRIVCYPTIGGFILKGQRMGLIRFGSRCDVFLPKSARVAVRVGQRVLGGETILAEL